MDDARNVLDSELGIPMKATEGLVLKKSLESPPQVWINVVVRALTQTPCEKCRLAHKVASRGC